MPNIEKQLAAWEDRWNKPELQAMHAQLKEQHQNLLANLLAGIEAYENIEKDLVWHGPSWKWTIEYSLTGPTKLPVTDPMAYFVPNPETPLLCIPLRLEHIAELPLKRLNRYVRDEIKTAKCAVSVHWCTWNPTAMTEVEHLLDLIKRKYKLLTGINNPKKKASA